jgi:hypothetical protein
MHVQRTSAAATRRLRSCAEVDRLAGRQPLPSPRPGRRLACAPRGRAGGRALQLSPRPYASSRARARASIAHTACMTRPRVNAMVSARTRRWRSPAAAGRWAFCRCPSSPSGPEPARPHNSHRFVGRVACLRACVACLRACVACLRACVRSTDCCEPARPRSLRAASGPHAEGWRTGDCAKCSQFMATLSIQSATQRSTRVPAGARIRPFARLHP